MMAETNEAILHALAEVNRSATSGDVERFLKRLNDGGVITLQTADLHALATSAVTASLVVDAVAGLLDSSGLPADQRVLAARSVVGAWRKACGGTGAAS